MFCECTQALERPCIKKKDTLTDCMLNYKVEPIYTLKSVNYISTNYNRIHSVLSECLMHMFHQLSKKTYQESTTTGCWASSGIFEKLACNASGTWVPHKAHWKRQQLSLSFTRVVSNRMINIAKQRCLK